MRVLYIYPHPDDESFGPANLMAKHSREGHQVYLLCLTKGGATKQRFKYNLSIEEMGDVRIKEMQCVAETLGLTGMKILDLPDSGLKELDPRIIEKAVADEIETIKPNVIVTYPVHGISGFHDHLITHSVVKRVFVDLHDKIDELKRLAFTTLNEKTAALSKHFILCHSTEKEIDCIETVEDEDIEKNLAALDCYVTFKETVDNSGVKGMISDKVYFEFFAEEFTPPASGLFEGI